MSSLYRRTIGKIWFQLTVLQQGVNNYGLLCDLFIILELNVIFFSYQQCRPRTRLATGFKVQWTGEICFTNFRKNNQNVRCIEVYNDYFTKPSILGCEQLSQYLAVYSFGIET